MLKYLILLTSLSLPFTAQADLYKIVDEDGNITFTDVAPIMGAKQHKLGRIESVKNPEFNLEKFNLAIPFISEGGAMIVQGSVNGVPMRFIVDTGATLTSIPPTIAKKAGLYELDSKEVTVQTANGKIKVSRIRIPTVTIAKATQPNVRATIQSIADDKPDLGLLGMSFFNRYKMTIHQDKNIIQLENK